MRFRYKFRNSDNVAEEGVTSAKSREDVYTVLAKKRIKPYFIELIPDPLRIPKFVAKVLLVSGGVLVCLCLFYKMGILRIPADNALSEKYASPQPRKQLYGDPVVIERGVISDWENLNLRESDRFLARYAQPGIMVRESLTNMPQRVIDDLRTNFSVVVEIDVDDTREHRQLKGIVSGIRSELRAFLSSGGSVERYIELLNERQHKECSIREEIVKKFKAYEGQLSGERLLDRWASANMRLRSMGLRTIPVPEGLTAAE